MPANVCADEHLWRPKDSLQCGSMEPSNFFFCFFNFMFIGILSACVSVMMSETLKLGLHEGVSCRIGN